MSDENELDDYRIGNVLNKDVRHVAYGWIAAIVAFVVLVSLIVSIGGIFGGWFSEATHQVSAANVKEQFRFVYDDLNSLKAEARQICTAQQAVKDAGTDPAVVSQRETQLIAEKNNYNRIAGEYDAHLQDAFRSKYIRPSDVPSRAPSVSDMTTQVC